MDSISKINSEVSVCTDCQLSHQRNVAVPGEGPEIADVMFVGEAPGVNEDKLGRPFVGAAGNFLDQLLMSANLDRADIYITNTVKCRPPNNRDPLPEERSSCRKYLERQIDLVKPKVVVSLGRHSLASFVPGETIGKSRGKARFMGPFTLFPMYHPAAALHQPNLRQVIVEDFEKLSLLLKDLHSSSQSDVSDASYNKKDTAGEQLSMF